MKSIEAIALKTTDSFPRMTANGISEIYYKHDNILWRAFGREPAADLFVANGHACNVLTQL
jgi:hypothetical protein